MRTPSQGYVVDSSLLIEYIIEDSPFRAAVAKLLEEARTRHTNIYLTPLTVSELIYISSRVYFVAGTENPNLEALNFVRWVMARSKLTPITYKIALAAGELKKRLGIALADCYVIATATELKLRALFLKPEREMQERLHQLRKLPVEFFTENISP